MGANVLEFALGLQTSEFLSKLGISADEVLSFAGLAEVVRTAWEHTWEAIGKGAELQGLSSRTGETVNQLYRFQQGLMAIGAPAENVQMLMLMTQKALSGVNDAGIRTDVLFQKIGLDLNQLHRTDTISAIKEISAALSHLGGNQGAGVAETLFGRFNAGTIIGLAHNLETFQRGFSLSSQTGALLDKFGKTFEEVKLDWQIIENDVLGIWVAIAGQIAPTLETLFTKIHDDLKNIGPAIVGAFQGGHISQLFEDIWAATWEIFRNYGEASMAAVSVFLGDTVSSVLIAAFSQIPTMLANVAANAADIAIAQKAKSFADTDVSAQQSLLKQVQTETPYQSDFADRVLGAKERYSQGRATGNDLDWIELSGMTRAQAIPHIRGTIDSLKTESSTQQGTINNLLGMTQDSVRQGISGVMNGVGGAIANGVHDGGEAFDNVLEHAGHKAQDLLTQHLKTWGTVDISDGLKPSGDTGTSPNDINLQRTAFRPEFTTLEKMGFIMSGGGRVQNPYDIRKVDLLQSIDNGIKKIAHIEPTPYMKRSDINQL